jgi:transposase
MEKKRIEMGQHERDVLRVMSSVLEGERTQGEAARLLGKSVRQVRRVQRRLEAEGDGGVVHRLRGKPSNHASGEEVRQRVLRLYREKYLGFGPTLAAEKLAGTDGVVVTRETLRQMLLAEGLWERRRKRDAHRSRRERRACFGELVQSDASTHDWLEGRGDRMALLGMIDDASSRVVARFYPAETSEGYMDVLGRWVKAYGRPLGWYSDRHGIFRAEDAEGEPTATQFSRALGELGIELILANSPQAKGRVERLWNTAQDRLVKELRLAGATTMARANEVLESVFLPWFNRECAVEPSSPNDAHLPLGEGHDLEAILSTQEQRTVANDYTIRFENRVYQLLPPAWPGQRGGKVVVEKRLDGSTRVRFKGRYLPYRQAPRPARAAAGDAADAAGPAAGCGAPAPGPLGALPPNPRSLTPGPIPAGAVAPPDAKGAATGGQAKGRAVEAARPPAVHRAAGRSGRTPAEPCPPGGGSCGTGSKAFRPAPDHPWRNGR